MKTGFTPEGIRPIIERSDQIYSNMFDGTATDQEAKFPMREPYERAQTEISHVFIPPPAPADASGGQDPTAASQAAQPLTPHDGPPTPVENGPVL